ncbi:hypothetical protein [Eudoraea adriatica]|uniref:hypothetical protein n=1 Tax=Eudoraea adriatica TaxID=446681 RepID=UPI0003746203|nr:hypothetical protein [Eudoraea adriatica]
MRQRLFIIPILIILLLWCSCRKDFQYDISSGNLDFSKDTVYLDTVFTNIGSSTYSLKVYNRSNSDIQIPNVRLAQGNNSSYRLNVDGEAGKEFENIPLMAKDSLYIFIETTFDISAINENEFLYTDAILFDEGPKQQEVQLVTLIKDAVFLYPSENADGTKETLLLGLDEDGNEIRIEGFLLTDEQLNFTNEKPYVIYGYAGVAPENVLNIEAGSRVHFHKDSGILVGQGASLSVNGSLSTDTLLLENEVIFEGDRLEPEFAEVPGQWGTIWLAPGSINNTMNYATIRNATVGLLVEGDFASVSPKLSVGNSKIYNTLSANILARSSSIAGENMVLGNAGNGSLICTNGGNYSFIHSTIANYWSNGFRSGAALQLSNYDANADIGAVDQDLTADFINCIVDGNTFLELSLNSNLTNLFDFSFTNCLIKFMDTSGQFDADPLYDFTNPAYYKNVFLNEDAGFLNTANNDFRLGNSSSAIGKADQATAISVPLDIQGTDRTFEPDIGAYEYIAKVQN